MGGAASDLARAGGAETEGALGAWNLIAVGEADVVLVQVKTRDWPGAAEMETMRAFSAPPNARKFAHRWQHRQRLPSVREV